MGVLCTQKGAIFYICDMKNKKRIKSIGTVRLSPYWCGGVVLVSLGMSSKDILEHIAENYLGGDRSTMRNLRRWKKLVSESKKEIDRVNDLKCTTKGSLICDSNSCDDPVLLMLVSPDFDFSNTEDMITLAHECLHLCQRMLPIYLDRDQEHEAEAYFHSYLMRECVGIIEDGMEH